MASGLPPVSSCTRASHSSLTTVSRTGRRRGCGQRPGRARRGPAASRPSTRSSASPARPTTSIATGSELSRRAAKTSALADERSSRWTSSSRTATGASSAYRQSRLSVAAPMANRSTGRPLLQRERRRQRSGLRRGDRVEQAQRGPQHGEQPGERDLALGLGAGRAQHAEPVEPTLGPAQQRGLADTRLAGDGEHATGTDPRPGDEPIDGLLLVLPSDQHPPSLGVNPRD